MKQNPTSGCGSGGNALLKRGEPLEAEIQRKNIDLAARTIAGLTEQWRVVLVHGNGRRVGLLALQNSAPTTQVAPPAGRSRRRCRGMIGYMLQQALKNSLLPAR